MRYFYFSRWNWRRPFLQFGLLSGALSLGCLYEAFRGIFLRNVNSITAPLDSHQVPVTGHDALITGLKWLCGSTGFIIATIFLLRMDADDSDGSQFPDA